MLTIIMFFFSGIDHPSCLMLKHMLTPGSGSVTTPRSKLTHKNLIANNGIQNMEVTTLDPSVHPFSACQAGPYLWEGNGAPAPGADMALLGFKTAH